MSEIVSGTDPGEAFMALIKSWGAPDHLISFAIAVRVDKPVEIVCRFYAKGDDGHHLIVDDALVEELQRFRLVRLEDAES